MRVISLFSGIGGSSEGYIADGNEVVAVRVRVPAAGRLGVRRGQEGGSEEQGEKGTHCSAIWLLLK